jgi:hypothetical protein
MRKFLLNNLTYLKKKPKFRKSGIAGRGKRGKS